MRTINRRLRKLEDRFGLAPETEFERRLRQAIAAALQRLAEARGRGEWSGPLNDDDREDLTGLR
jgi:hypothetical protein